MKKHLLALALLTATVFLAGCISGYGVEFVGEKGSSDEFANGHLAMDFELGKSDAVLTIRNTTVGTITLYWPENSFILPDGTAYTMVYLEGMSCYGALEDNVGYLFLLESGRDDITVSVVNGSGVDLKEEEFVSFLPRKISEKGQISFRVALVRDPYDFTSPLKVRPGTDDFNRFPAKLGRYEPGQTFSWKFKYSLQGCDELIDDEVVFRLVR